MATLLVLTELMAGGPGSGCQGQNCGRPLSAREVRREDLKKQIEQVRLQLKIKRGQKGYITKHRRENLKIVKKGLQTIRRYDRRDKIVPGLVRRAGKLTIQVEPVKRGAVRKQFVSQEGHKITILKQAKEYEKTGKTWIGKPSQYKGQFKRDSEDFIQKTRDNPKERNSFWVARTATDNAVSVELHRNLGDLKVKVVERQLGEYNSIARHREVTFNNIGTASGFLNRRYGITFGLKQGRV